MSSSAYHLVNTHFNNVKWTGDEALVNCPYHNDEHPSCSINAEKEVFKCFACGESGHLREMANHLCIEYNNDECQNDTVEYIYQNTDGSKAFTLIKTIERNGKKKFHRDVKGYDKPILYKFPDVLEASNQGTPIIWVEGEKDVESLRSKGYKATTTPNGANSIKSIPSIVKLLPPSASIILCGDADKPGQKYIHTVGKALIDRGIQSKIIRPEDMSFTVTDKGGKDISDWLRENSDIQSLIDNARPFYIESNKKKDNKINTELKLDEQGIAEMMADLYSENIKYVQAHRKWYIYKDGCWITDETNHVYAYIKEIQKELHHIASETTQEKEREAIEDFIRSLRSRYKQKNIIELLKNEQKISIHPNDFDKDKYLFNVSNGTINLETGILQDHNPSDLITRSSSVAYNPSSKCDRWLQFLYEIFLADQDTINFMQRYLGLVLSGDTREHIFPVFYGTGANGKSVLINTIHNIMSNYFSMTPSSTLMANKNTSNTNDIARLKGIRFVAAQESGNGIRLDEEKIKTMTGGDKLVARYLYGEYFEFIPEFKIVLITNHKPRIKGSDNGIWRRVLLIPFRYTVPSEKQDKQLESKLKNEAEGILSWMVEGFRLWQEDGLNIPESIRSSTEEYQKEEDSLGLFLDNLVIDSPYHDIQVAVLYDKFKAWCLDTGEYPLDSREFNKRMEAKGYEKKRKSSAVFWLNVAFIN